MALSSSLVGIGILVGIYSLLALGLNVKYGYTGLLEIGHVAFFLVGAHVTALLMLPPAEERRFVEHVLGWGWSWFPSVFAAMVVAGVLGGLVALPAIRLREDYLAIVVLGLAIILQFIVRNERWLANGTDGLYGIQRPFGDLFPLPNAEPEAAVLFGASVAVLWVAASVAYGYLRRRRSFDPLSEAVVTASTLGLTLLVRRRVDDEARLRTPLLAGAVAGAAAAIGSFYAVQPWTLLVFLGGFSLASWVLAVQGVLYHYSEVDLASAAAGFGLAVGLLATLAPIALLPPEVGMYGAGFLLMGYGYLLYRLALMWSRNVGFVRVAGVAAVSLFALRYFVLEAYRHLGRGGVSRMLRESVENVLWMAGFDAADVAGLFGTGAVSMDYSRFLLVLTVALVAVTYYSLELSVKSPWGRVLKSIREDEDVANALGKNVFSYKVQSMVLGSAVAGLAGGLFAIHLRSFSYADFAPEVTFIVFLMVIVGGTANNAGVVLGSALYWAFDRATQDIAGYFPSEQAAQIAALRRAFIGVLLLLVLYYMPQGVWRETRGTYGGEGG